jgi:hypothetical protein
MRAEILTKDLLKIVNPSKDGIFYKGQIIALDWKELKEHVEHPKKNDVFKSSGDFTKDLYKNLALYIINSEDKPSLISLDLNTPAIFEPGHGLFEYIKNIYNKEEKSYINIDETGDNLLFIKSKKLEELPNDFEIFKAEDIHSTVSSVFNDTTKLDLSKIKTDRGQFDWQEEDVDRYSKLEYVLEKVEEIFKYRKSSRYDGDREKQLTPEQKFYNLLEITNKELIHSDAFKLALLDSESSSLKEFLTSRYNKENDYNFSIDFSQPIFQAKILENVQKKDFVLLEKIFENYLEEIHDIDSTYHWSRKDKKPEVKEPIDFALFFNLPETIHYLAEKYHYNTYTISSNTRDFHIANAYKYLNEENKRDKAVLDKYLELITYETREGLSINQDLFQKLPPEVINDPKIINKVCSALDYGDLKEFFDEKKIDCPNYSNKEIIIQNANKPYPYRLSEWIHRFIPKQELDVDFFKSVIQKKPDFYEKMNESFPSFAKDWDIITSAVKSGFKVKNIKHDVMKSLLLKNHTPEQEQIKVRYLIETRNLDNFRHLFSKADDIEKAKAKYHKPEYMFFIAEKSSFFSEIHGAKQVLSKIKSHEEIMSILDKIKTNSFGYEFNSNHFYSSLNSTLKKDKAITNRIMDMGGIKYSYLDEQLAYNAEIVIKCLEENPSEVKYIPNELFSNSKFSVQFAGLLDQGRFEEQEIPSFVRKFFDNQGVKENYQDYLKSYIEYKQLHKDFEVQKPIAEAPKPRKMKI